jgi:hypothetical protein
MPRAAATFFRAAFDALLLAILYSHHDHSCQVYIIATQSWLSVVSIPAIPIAPAVSAGETMDQLAEKCLVQKAATPRGLTKLVAASVSAAESKIGIWKSLICGCVDD